MKTNNVSFTSARLKISPTIKNNAKLQKASNILENIAPKKDAEISILKTGTGITIESKDNLFFVNMTNETFNKLLQMRPKVIAKKIKKLIDISHKQNETIKAMDEFMNKAKLNEDECTKFCFMMMKKMDKENNKVFKKDSILKDTNVHLY